MTCPLDAILRAQAELRALQDVGDLGSRPQSTILRDIEDMNERQQSERRTKDTMVYYYRRKRNAAASDDRRGGEPAVG